MRGRMLVVLVAVVLVALAMPMGNLAAEEAITCTVSAALVSVTVSDGTVAYGSLALGASANTTPTGVNESQHVTNNGTVVEDFFIKSSDAARGGGTTWELVETSPLHNEFKHEWSSTAGPPWTTMNASNDYSAYVGPVNPGVTVQLDLQITMPSTTDDYQEHTITVTVMAAQAGECVDNDGDGYGIGPGCSGPDCNDTDAFINPGALDICDGLDNDCNPATADGSDDPLSGAPCDGPDSDLCAEGTGSCSGGVITCSDMTGDNLDICDGADNDCNPATADGADEPNLGTPCDGADSDLCEEGTLTCAGGPGLTCDDTTGDNLDLCNGSTMDDCNPATADGADEPNLGTPCDGPDSDLCEEGTWICAGGPGLTCSDTTGDTLEICGDGIDNDCDGATDEGCP